MDTSVLGRPFGGRTRSGTRENPLPPPPPVGCVSPTLLGDGFGCPKYRGDRDSVDSHTSSEVPPDPGECEENQKSLTTQGSSLPRVSQDTGAGHRWVERVAEGPGSWSSLISLRCRLVPTKTDPRSAP